MRPRAIASHLVDRRVTRFGTVRARPESRADQVRAQVRRRPRRSTSGLTSSGSSMVRFSTAPSASTTTRTATCDEIPTICTERTAAVSWPVAEDDRHVVGEPGEQPARTLEQLLHLAVDLGVEGTDLPVLDGAENARTREVVHEVPVAPVGRDPAGRRVRLEEEALALEGRHLASDRRRRDPDPGRHVRRPDGLGGLHVLCDHRVQDRRLAGVELVACGRARPRRGRRLCRPSATRPFESLRSCAISFRPRLDRSCAVWHSILPSARSPGPQPGPDRCGAMRAAGRLRVRTVTPRGAEPR